MTNECPHDSIEPCSWTTLNDERVLAGLLQIGIDTGPDKPGGQIVFDSAHSATEEEAMKAMEALFLPEGEEDDDEVSG